MNNKKRVVMPFIFISLFIVLTISLILIDVRTIGETNEEVGLGFINKLSANISYNETLDKISDIFLIISIVSIFTFATIGLIQLIKRKSLFKVDKDIILFGLLLVVMAILWISFEKFIIINYRPILIEGEIEASYPSTHIMIVTFVLLASINLISKYLKDKRIIKIGYLLAIIFIITTTLLRFLSGMHWITDCLGGIILGLFLYYIYLYLKGLLNKISQ